LDRTLAQSLERNWLPERAGRTNDPQSRSASRSELLRGETTRPYCLIAMFSLTIAGGSAESVEAVVRTRSAKPW
jgi:hypothetical protein